MIISPRTSHLISDKYRALPLAVSKLEPIEVGHIFKNAQNPFTFFPALGIFSAEFSLCYCHNMHFHKNKDSSNGALHKTTRKKWNLTQHAKQQ